MGTDNAISTEKNFCQPELVSGSKINRAYGSFTLPEALQGNDPYRNSGF